MRDFDIARAERETADRTFKIGGQEFTFRAYVHPNDLITLQQGFGEGDRGFLDIVDDVLPRALLEPGQEAAWEKVRSADNEKPLSIYDIVEVLNYVTEVATGRPTVRSSDSSPTPSPTGTASKGASRSKALNSVA